MKFRPCIDIHNGKVKQIVGSSLRDDQAPLLEENFVSDLSAEDFAIMYKKAGLVGGHVILLNKAGTEGYKDTYDQCLLALKAYPGGLQAGGGITDENALEFLEAGASHVIVTSHVFYQGEINMERLKRLSDITGKDRLVLDLSVKIKPDGYHIVTDRWQVISSEILSLGLLEKLSHYCDEFLIHAADVEGKRAGVDEKLLNLLSGWEGAPITYAGGIKDMDDILLIKELGKERINFTAGSALDIFGGNLQYSVVSKL